MRCPSCGAENRDGARFCRQCAGALPAAPSESTQACPNCGARVPSGTRFCVACGASVDRVQPPPARTVRPAMPPARPAQPSPPPWSPPPAQSAPPPVAPPRYAAPPRPRRGLGGCGWVLIVGGVLGGVAHRWLGRVGYLVVRAGWDSWVVSYLPSDCDACSSDRDTSGSWCILSNSSGLWYDELDARLWLD